jgi:trimeric autotransporter adhesin
MATINHSSGADIIVPSNGGTTYRGLGGDDTYILSNSIAANAAITIVDTSGANTIQLVDGLSIASSKFAADAVQLTLSNGAVVTINGASNFSYDLGGNATSGVTGSSNTLTAFATTMGVATLPSSGSTAGSSDVTISNSGVSSSASPTFTVTKSTSKVAEGSDVTFTITASSAVSSDTTFSWSAMGDTNGSTVTAAGNADITTLSGSATIASGSTSTTFIVGAVNDATVEGLEGMKVSVFDSNAAAISSSNILIDNTGSASTTQSFTGTAGVNNFTGGDGDDSFDFSTAASFQDIDKLDGGNGTDTLTVSYTAAGSLKPDLENIEDVIFTNSAAATNDLTINAVDTASGYDNITNLSSTGGLLISNLQAIPSSFTINNAGDTMLLDFEAAALAGTADNLLINLTGTGTLPTLEITGDAGDIESITLNSTAQANTLTTLTTADVDPTLLTITGDQSLTITNALSAEIATIDASAATGGVTLSAAPGVVAGVTYTGGAGNDVLTGTAAGADNISTGGGSDTITMTSLAATDVIDGGDGADTLVIAQDVASATVMGGVSNVETLEVTGARDLDLVANVSTTTFDFSGNAKQTLDIDEGYTNETTVIMAKLGAAGLVVDDAGTDSFVNLANVTSHVYVSSQDMDGDTSELTVTGGTGTDNLYVYLTGNPTNPTAADELGDSVTAFENITIMDSPFGNTNTAIDLGTTFLPGTGKDITIDSSALDAADTAGGLTFSVDASDVAVAAAGSKITVTDGDNAASYTLGNNADTATMNGGNDTVVGTAGNNTISMGAGNDSVTAGTGVENISGGAGNDTINVGTANLTALDTIDGGDGTDTLVVGAGIASATILGGVSNVEVLEATGNGATITLAANISATTFDLSSVDDQDLTLNAGYTDTATVTIGATASDDIDNGSSPTTSANTTLIVNGPASSWAGTTVVGGTGSDTVNISQVAADQAVALGSSVTGVEAFNITDSTLSNTADVDVTITTYATAATWDATSMDAGEDTTINLTNATAAQVIKGGEGGDAITGGTKGDTITGNGGIDAINGGAGLDNIDAGAGNDTITMSTEAQFSTTLGTDTVDAGAGTDTLTFSAAATLTTAEVSNISNVEVLSLTTGSSLTVNDAFLAANPGIVIQPGATSTITASSATGDSLTTAINIAANAAGNLNLTGGSGDDTFTFYATETLTALDSVNGGAGDDQIIIDIVDATPQAGVGANTTAVLDAQISNVETVTIRDAATDDGGGGGTVITATITVNAGFTGAALTIDGSSLDMHPTTLTGGERLTATASSNTAAEVVTMIGGAFSDSLTGGSGADTFTGNGGADTIKGGAGSDTIDGGTGADSLYGGAGMDNISGGAGNDAIVVDTFTDFKTSGGSETIDGGEGTDTLLFNQAAALTITAPEMESVTGIEIIDASDTISTNATSITLGNGFFTSNGTTTVTYDGNDSGTGASNTLDLSSVTNGSAIFFPNDTATDVDDVFKGGSGDDTYMIVGTAAAGLEATDTFTGNGGTDQFLITNTTAITAVMDMSVVTGVEKAVVQYNSTGAVDFDLGAVASTDTEMAAFEMDGSAVVSSTGTLKFNKSDVNSSLMATAFTVKGGVNADTIYGGYQADTITGNGGADDLYGNAGADTITSGAGADEIEGNAGADNITSGGGVDTVTGGTGNDTINAGDGNDIITGSAGKDVITGGSGADTFIYTAITESAGANFDEITDFVSGSDDIRVSFSMPTGSTFVATDRGDTASDGSLPGIMGGVIGDAAFITDSGSLAIDFTGDGIVNANDFKVQLTGNTAMSIDDVDFYITNLGITTTKTAGGNDSVLGTSAVDTVYTFGGNDTVTGTAGDDIIWTGAGNDTITVAGGTETVYIDTLGGYNSITGATVATDNLFLSEDGSTVATDGATAVIGAVTAATPADGAAYDFTAAIATNAADLFEIEAADSDSVDQVTLEDDKAAASNGTALFKALVDDLGDATDTISSITVSTAGDKFYAVAYDNGDAYIYFLDSAKVVNDASVTVNEVELVAFIDTVTADAFASDANTAMRDLTDLDATY